MIGEHVLTLTETNTRSYVPACSCGWMGLAHGTPVARNDRGGIEHVHKSIARDNAQAEHVAHVQRCARPLVDRMNP